MPSTEEGLVVEQYEEERVDWNNDGLGDDRPRTVTTLPEVSD